MQCAPNATPAPRLRNVFVGRHSNVWQRLSAPGTDLGAASCAISHREIGSFEFTPSDRVWVLAYSRRASDNASLLRALARTPAVELVYVSSSSTIVESVTRCYRYPRIKHAAELEALTWPNVRVLTLGMMYEEPDELPGGENIATSYRDLAAFVRSPSWPDEGGRRMRLFRVVRRPFDRPWKGRVHAVYAGLLTRAGRWPCLLRPLDLVLRALGVRTYGYVQLSNTLWTSTTS